MLVPIRQWRHRTILRPIVKLLRGEMLAEPGVAFALDLLDVMGAGPEGTGHRDNRPSRFRRESEIHHGAPIAPRRSTSTGVSLMSLAASAMASRKAM